MKELKKKNYDVAYLDIIEKIVEGIKARSYELIPRQSEHLKILDIGCGSGEDCRKIHQILAQDRSLDSFQIIGVDHEESFLRSAKERSGNGEFPSLKFEKRSAESLGFESGTFDYIRMERIVQHLAFPEESFANAVRVLRPGSGRLLIAETDWTSVSFGTTDLETERLVIDQKIEHDLTNGMASRMLPEYIVPPLKANISYHPSILDTVEMANYIFGIDRNLKALANRGWTGGDAFVQKLEKLEKRGVFRFTWNMIMLEIWKEE